MYDFLIILWICIGSIMGIILLYSGIKYLNTLFYRNKLKRQYNINFIPSSFKIKKNKKGYDGVYELKYPEWLYSNKNGSRNRVRKNNKLVYYPCNLYYREFEITTKNPIDMLNLVQTFRNRLGERCISKNKEELDKYKEIMDRLNLCSKSNELQTIIDKCRDYPAKFEEFCSNLFKRMEYIVKITPKVNDGGYDLILHKDGEKSIVECKCYALRHNVGRPLIQKLVGANQEAQADRMIFITTSHFTKEAIKYAEEVDVELIDGETLMRLANKHFNENSNKVIKVYRRDWELNTNDIRKYYPPDVEI